MKQLINSTPNRIGIVGAGFSGVATALSLARLCTSPLTIYLCEKNSEFAEGEAYRTNFPYHYLNVRAGDMSAFEDEPTHFVNWLKANDYTRAYLEQNIPIAQQFVPRVLYQHYLKSLLKTFSQQKNISVELINAEVVDVIETNNEAQLILSDQKKITVDKVILTIGNMLPAGFPFPVTDQRHSIPHAWDYLAPKEIAPSATVLIVGTGLSMIDTVLTLYHQKHQGKIYAISRHGLIPLPHSDHVAAFTLPNNLPTTLKAVMREILKCCRAQIASGGDWRDVINAVRHEVQTLWKRMNHHDKKQFLRHVSPYWNIHRHRVPLKIAEILNSLQKNGQLEILSGRVLSVQQQTATIRLRHDVNLSKIKIDWLINCTGPNPKMSAHTSPLIQALLNRGEVAVDALDLGFEVDINGAIKKRNGQVSKLLYSLGPPIKGHDWECTAVPDIRKQIKNLVEHLILKT